MSIDIKDPEGEGFSGYLKKEQVEAVRISSRFTVKVVWQNSPLHGKAGDWLIINPANYPDLGICDGDIFKQTYQ